MKDGDKIGLLLLAAGGALWLWHKNKQKAPPATPVMTQATATPGAPPIQHDQNGVPMSASTPSNGQPMIAPLPDELSTQGVSVEEIAEAPPVYANFSAGGA